TENFDTRLQLLESPLETIQTADGQQLVVRAFLMWQVDTEGNGPLAFGSSYDSTEQAGRLLLDQFRDSLSVLSKYSFDELIGGQDGRLAEAEAALLDQMMSVRGKGVLPVTAGVSQLLLPPKTTTAVLSRMYQTRQRLAEAERFKGRAEAERIMSEAKTIAETIRAFAELRAEEIRSEGNEKAREYLEKLREDEEFAIYLVHLDALAQMLDKTTTLLVPTNVAPFDKMNLEGVSAAPRSPVSRDPDTGEADAPVAEAATETEPS
ncbi:MAG: SPFH domain-containing protein, partial [Planctomycetota bacterium]